MIAIMVNSTVTAVPAYAMKDILGLPAPLISMNAKLFHLSVKVEACALMVKEISAVRVLIHAKMTVTLAVAAPVQEEVPVAVIVQIILLVNVHLGILESVVKIFKVCDLAVGYRPTATFSYPYNMQFLLFFIETYGIIIDIDIASYYYHFNLLLK